MDGYDRNTLVKKEGGHGAHTKRLVQKRRERLISIAVYIDILHVELY